MHGKVTLGSEEEIIELLKQDICPKCKGEILSPPEFLRFEEGDALQIRCVYCSYVYTFPRINKNICFTY